MVKAILRKGVILPLEPLPPEWEEGVPLQVDRAPTGTVDMDAWAQTMNELCGDSLPEEEERMRQAIDEHRQQAKEQMRRQMGLGQ